MTITHCHSTSLAATPDTTRSFVECLNAADRGHVVVLEPGPADLGKCWFCDPAADPVTAVARVTWTDRFGRRIERNCCALCIGSALNEALSDGGDVTIRAIVGDAP